jgi:UDP-galactopyranose mutase
MDIDYLVVGAGLTGATLARRLHDAGHRVLVVDRRPHVAGVAHDHVHPSGIRVHTYGPHQFRTDDETIWRFVNRFAAFFRYEPSIKTLVDGQLEHWPVVASYIRRTVGAGWKPEFTGTPGNFEEAALALMPRIVYEKFVKGYTEKQWGVPAVTLAANLVRRFDVREDDEPRLVRHKHQGIPADGYEAMVVAMLKDIPTLLNLDYLKEGRWLKPRRKLIFTGPIDEYSGFDLGRLRYRGQRRVHEYHADVDWLQPCGQVNNPDPHTGEHVRTLEWKHMMAPQYAQRIHGTLLTRETPYSPQNPDDYEYPFPDDGNDALFQRYRRRMEALPDVLVCGRLGDYRYYDMDQAIARALVLADELLAGSPRPR